MRKLLIIIVAGMLVTVGCTSKKTEYAAEDGSVKAVHNERSDTWVITDSTGLEPVSDYDSMRVTEVGEEGHPMTVHYYKGDVETVIQYYSTMARRSMGQVVAGQREGAWVFYHPDGSVQAEATFVNGREEGAYRVFRPNGIPYYLGQYTHGVRTGTWEVYDEDGNLVITKNYD